MLRVAPGVNPLSLLAPAGRDGAIGRNTFRSPGVVTFDLAVMKTVDLHKDLKATFRAEAFNLFNRTHFGTPVRILESPGFGSAVSTSVPARTIQFALKFSF